jgi:hypothetical protein
LILEGGEIYEATTVYIPLGLKANYCSNVGKVSMKHDTLPTMLQDGYTAHLATSLAHGVF